jgi:RHS repeat-associated protein
MTASTGTVSTNLGYAGQYTDPTTGFEYDQARWYDPGTGAFITVDPAEQTTGQPYSYANDDPITNTDPSGLMCDLNPFSSGGGCLGDVVDAVGQGISDAAPYVAPAIDVGAGLACIAVSAGTCGYIIAGNFIAQQLLAADQAVYRPSYNLGENEAAIFTSSALGLLGVSVAQNFEDAAAAGAPSILGRIAKTLVGATVSSPAWLLDGAQEASAATLVCR